MVSNKVLWILSGIIGSIFLIIVISLAVADKIKTSSLIIFIIIIILVVITIDLLFLFIRREKRVSVEKEGKKIKVIDLETAREMAKGMLMSLQYSEYIRDERYEDVWHMGESKTPVYVRLVKGEFDGNLLGLVINMEDPIKRGIKEYREVDISEKDILNDIERRANFVAMSPRPMPSQEEEIIERPTGERITRKRRISKEDKLPSQQEGGLK